MTSVYGLVCVLQTVPPWGPRALAWPLHRTGQSSLLPPAAWLGGGSHLAPKPANLEDVPAPFIVGTLLQQEMLVDLGGRTGAKVDFCQEKMRKHVTSYLPDSFMRVKRFTKLGASQGMNESQGPASHLTRASPSAAARNGKCHPLESLPPLWLGWLGFLSCSCLREGELPPCCPARSWTRSEVMSAFQSLRDGGG